MTTREEKEKGHLVSRCIAADENTSVTLLKVILLIAILSGTSKKQETNLLSDDPHQNFTRRTEIIPPRHSYMTFSLPAHLDPSDYL